MSLSPEGVRPGSDQGQTSAAAAQVVSGGVTAPRGFRAAGIACGIKRRPASAAEPPRDLAVIAAEAPVSAAAMFTINKAVAAPVVVSRDHLRRSGGVAQAIVINSGCANACTGPAGDRVARGMADAAATAIGCAPDHVLIASTGVIGVQLDLERVAAGIDRAVSTLSEHGGDDATLAIMTTDPFPKSHAVRVETGAGSFTVGGMAKGSGMIEPRMATMLAVLTTDARVAPEVLAGALRRVTSETFNAITVDGECSTNDTVFLLASGAADVEITRDDDPQFLDALRAVAGHLAREIVRGGEGATKLVTVKTRGAITSDDAWKAARTVANSPLVKTAIHGGDPNWGRLVAAAGRSGAAFVLERASVWIGAPNQAAVQLFAKGTPHDERADDAAAVLQGAEIVVEIDLGTGGAFGATMWTCDFSAEYVRINAEYRT